VIFDWDIFFKILVLVSLGVLIVIHLQLLWNQSRKVDPVLRELAAVRRLAGRVETSVESERGEWRCRVIPKGVWLKRVTLEVPGRVEARDFRAPDGWSVRREDSRITWEARNEEAETAAPALLSFSTEATGTAPCRMSAVYVYDGPAEESVSEFLVLGPA
jgi:hypothetical protein